MISEYHPSYYCVKSLYWQEDMCIFILYDDTRIVGVHSTKQFVGIKVGGFRPPQRHFILHMNLIEVKKDAY